MNSNKTIGITGASGSLGIALTKRFENNGYKIIGFTHNKNILKKSNYGTIKWIYWESGKEILLKKYLKEIDILILNHGIYENNNKVNNLEKSIEINALSNLRILNLFEQILLENKDELTKKEIWINTSEAEIFPAFSPSYEISKLLIGQIISFKKFFIEKNIKNRLRIRKIILGPFKSELNPIGIMNPDLVAFLIYVFSKMNINLIVVSLNPMSYILFPLKEIYYFFYSIILIFLKKQRS